MPRSCVIPIPPIDEMDRVEVFFLERLSGSCVLHSPSSEERSGYTSSKAALSLRSSTKGNRATPSETQHRPPEVIQL